MSIPFFKAKSEAEKFWLVDTPKVHEGLMQSMGSAYPARLETPDQMRQHQVVLVEVPPNQYVQAKPGGQYWIVDRYAEELGLTVVEGQQRAKATGTKLYHVYDRRGHFVTDLYAGSKQEAKDAFEKRQARMGFRPIEVEVQLYRPGKMPYAGRMSRPAQGPDRSRTHGRYAKPRLTK